MGVFDGKTVLVTGGSTGIGRATSIAFAEAGANVVIGDVDPRAAETVAAIQALGGQALFVETDVVDPRAVNVLIERAVSAYGGLHCAFNNAGILPPTCPVHEVTDDDFDRIMAVDVKGVFNCMRAEIQYFLTVGGGAIVNTASVAGVIADPGMSAYVAAKHAVVGMTKAAAIEYVQQNIRVNALAPGFTQTPMTQRWIDDPVFVEQVMMSMPAKRAAAPQEIAGTVLHLCSDAASFTTGSVVIVDGGQTAH